MLTNFKFVLNIKLIREKIEKLQKRHRKLILNKELILTLSSESKHDTFVICIRMLSCITEG